MSLLSTHSSPLVPLHRDKREKKETKERPEQCGAPLHTATSSKKGNQKNLLQTHSVGAIVPASTFMYGSILMLET
jgi:hypothetical protein